MVILFPPGLLGRFSICSECSVSFSLVFLSWHSMASSSSRREWKSTLVLFGRRQQCFSLQISQLVAWVGTHRNNSQTSWGFIRCYTLKTDPIFEKWSCSLLWSSKYRCFLEFCCFFTEEAQLVCSYLFFLSQRNMCDMETILYLFTTCCKARFQQF